jgi:replicative DNA helicase
VPVSVTELPRTSSGPEFERTPPQDIAAEQCVLGGMLLSKDAIADVVEVVRTIDFYRPAHQTIFDTVLDLYARGEPADAVTVHAQLGPAEAERLGGAAYLHTLISAVPTAANAGYYARIVRERAVLRRLVEAGTRIVQLGYGAADSASEADDVVDAAQAAVYDVTDRRTSEDYLPLEKILPTTLDELDAIQGHGGALSGVPTGFRDLDELTNGLHPGQLAVLAARPALGKSTLGLDFSRSASIKNGLTSVIFSLEMSRSEITMRLLSAEAGVPLHHMRSGSMGDADWTKLARRMGEVADAPLFIDDSPNLSMMEIRAKARRLKQRHDLRLIVVDYLQLMTSPRRVESRQQEVSELSRAEAARQGARRTGRRRQPAQPQLRAAHRQEAPAVRPARVRRDRAGLRRRRAALPRGRLRPRLAAGRRGRPDRRQAPQRPDEHRHRRVPGPLLPFRRHAAGMTTTGPACACRFSS